MGICRKLALAASVPAMITLVVAPVHATDYEVGEGAGMLAGIGEVPWESLGASDRVLIHWRATPYTEKWVLCRRGSAAAPIVISGVPGPAGQLPVIDGRDAVTRTQLDYWNQSRGVLKIGGASTPPDTLPAHIVIENLEIRSGRPPYSFTNSDSDPEDYANNAAAIYVEKAEHLVIRNCVPHDSGNGLFIGAYDGATQDILINDNWIYNNGIEGRFYEHNTVVSTRSGNTTLMRLSTNDEYADVRNNVIYTTAPGSRLAMLSESGHLHLRSNWLKDGWVDSHSSFSGSIIDHGTNIEETDPGFHDFARQDYPPIPSSPCEDTGGALAAAALPDHDPTRQYSRHQRASIRPDNGARDIGALETGVLFADGFEDGNESNWTTK